MVLCDCGGGGSRSNDGNGDSVQNKLVLKFLVLFLFSQEKNKQCKIARPNRKKASSLNRAVFADEATTIFFAFIFISFHLELHKSSVVFSVVSMPGIVFGKYFQFILTKFTIVFSSMFFDN